MIEDGLFKRFPVDAVFALHNWPGMPAGEFGARVGATQASSNEFEIRIKGVGAHAAIPHNGVDPVFTAMQIGTGLQSIMTRNKRPIDAAVLSITQIKAGEAINVIPDKATLAGTVRTFSVDVLDLIETRMREIAKRPPRVWLHRRSQFRAQLSADRQHGQGNAFRVGRDAGNRGRGASGADVDPTMGAEDFSFMLLEGRAAMRTSATAGRASRPRSWSRPVHAA